MDIDDLVATLQLIVGELAGLEHGQQGGDGVLEQHRLLLRQLVLLLNLERRMHGMWNNFRLPPCVTWPDWPNH